MRSHEPALWMWVEACELLDRAEGLRRHFFRPGHSGAWEPPVDMFETQRELWIMVALPGVGIEQIGVALSDGAIFVSGERRIPVETGALIHRLEIPHGRFERRIPLPHGRFELRRREFANGCLVLELGKIGLQP